MALVNLSPFFVPAAGGTPFDLTNATYSKSFLVQSQDAGPRSVLFSTDGLKMFMLGAFTSTVYQYTMSTAFDLTGASYSGSSLNIGGQVSTPEGLAFSTDGMKMFVFGETDAVFEYTLVSAFTLAGGSYSGNSTDVSGQITSPQSVTFSPDGLKMFVGGSTTDSVFEYTLASAFDLSGLVTYTGNSYNFNAQDAGPTSVAFSPDGLKMFAVGVSTDTAYQYTVASAFDLSSTVTYTGISLDVSGHETFPAGITFSADGLTFFVVGSDSDSVHQYAL